MPTVLVVDDDAKFLDSVANMLVSSGYHVIRAIDGNEAVGLLEKRHSEIDLAIVDLALPGINGFEIVGAISRRPNHIKIIAITSVYKDVNFETVGALGAHAAIRKPAEGRPLPEQEWLATVRRLIGEPTPAKRANEARAQGTGDDTEP